MEKVTELKLIGIAKRLEMIPKDNGDTWQATIRQLYDFAELFAQDQKMTLKTNTNNQPWLTDQELLDISDQMSESEKQITFEHLDDENGEVIMNIGPFITAYGKKVAAIQAEKILQMLESMLQEEEDLDELFQELRKKLLLGDK